MTKTALAFAAHHDDIEFRAGGTVAKLVKSGYRVIYVVAIDSVYVGNDYPHGHNLKDLNNEDILAIRESECYQGAAVLGTGKPLFLHLKPSYYWTNETKLEFRPNFGITERHITAGMESYKGEFFCLEAASQEKCVKETMDFIDSFNPEIVLTQNVNDFHLEHYAVAALAFISCQRLQIERKRNLSLYGWETGSRGRIMPFVADRIIDITDFFETKLESIKPFISQVALENMDAHLHKMETSALFWGSKIGVKYAEPFTRYLTSTRTNGFDQTNEIFSYSSQVAADIKKEL
jgi:LmbE family N-acetylglucosaminyl deacetylase